ncbi:MAG: tripartite tricarboxylate transporter permease [Acidobacteria bacterium]|nr:tripartite tricarboxylate transporter permease [Acidobacteriota bacterium]
MLKFYQKNLLNFSLLVIIGLVIILIKQKTFQPVFLASWEGLKLVFCWPNILYPIVATLLTMIFALLPGLSGATLMALAVSLTLSWEPLYVLLIFGAFVGGSTFMGSVTAILFNIPGSGPSAATLLDGYPLAQKGEAKTAIGCSAAASAMGSSFGVFVLILLIPFMSQAILIFSSPEFLMLTLWGLTTIAAISTGSILKGLIMGGLGFLISFIGQDPRTAEARYSFGITYLADGLSMIPILLGLFSISEIIALSVSGQETISGKTRVEELTGSVWKGVQAVFENFNLFIRSSIIGTIIGIIPGVGGTVASFVAYAQAAQTAKEPKHFGQGDIRGVLAPEAAHDAKDGGSLVPTLAFGIPGNEGTAILLAALLLHGLAPGKELLTNNLTLVFVLVWSLFFSNWITSILGVLVVSPLARLTLVRTQIISPIILVLTIIGAFTYKQRIEDVLLVFICGIVGYYLKKHAWPRIPFIIALVLGNLFETNFHISLKLNELGRINFWTRPIVIVLLILIIINLALPILQSRQKARKAND